MALMPVADALKAVLEGASGLPEELVALDDARGRVLARDLTAMRTQPPNDMSAMDGYAVRAADATLSARLKVIGEVAAGRPFARTVAGLVKPSASLPAASSPQAPTRSSSRKTRRVTAISSRSMKPRALAATSAARASIFAKATCC